MVIPNFNTKVIVFTIAINWFQILVIALLDNKQLFALSLILVNPQYVEDSLSNCFVLILQLGNLMSYSGKINMGCVVLVPYLKSFVLMNA